jgi:hypothetical protein
MKLSEKERKTLKELKEKLLDATHPEEVKYYFNQINELLDKIETREKTK